MGVKSKTLPERVESAKPPRSLCFEYCSESDLPRDSAGIKKVIAALKRFSSDQTLMARDYHKLSSSHPAKKTQQLIRHFAQPLYSIDVGSRGGDLGNYRLVFYHDPVHPSIAKVVSIFHDDH